MRAVDTGSEGFCAEDGDICVHEGREVFCEDGGDVCAQVVKVDPLDGGTLPWSSMLNTGFLGVLKSSSSSWVALSWLWSYQAPL